METEKPIKNKYEKIILNGQTTFYGEIECCENYEYINGYESKLNSVILPSEPCSYINKDAINKELRLIYKDKKHRVGYQCVISDVVITKQTITVYFSSCEFLINEKQSLG